MEHAQMMERCEHLRDQFKLRLIELLKIEEHQQLQNNRLKELEKRIIINDKVYTRRRKRIKLIDYSTECLWISKLETNDVDGIMK